MGSRQALLDQQPDQEVIGPHVISGVPTADASKALLQVGTIPAFSGSANGTLVGGSTKSGFTGNILDLQVGGVSKAKIAADGTLTIVNITASGTISGSIAASPPFSVVGAVPADATKAAFEIGGGSFGGGGAPAFNGNAAGTVFGMNVPGTYTGDLINIQIAGVSVIQATLTGFLLAAGSITDTITAGSLNYGPTNMTTFVVGPAGKAMTYTAASGNLTVSAGGITVTGNSTITGTLGGLTGLTVVSGGATITAGGLTITAGNITASAGNSNLTLGTGTITSGLINGQTISAAASFTGTVTAATGMTVTSGGLTVTAGGITVTAGNITASAGNSNLTLGTGTITSGAINASSTLNISAAGAIIQAGGLNLGSNAAAIGQLTIPVAPTATANNGLLNVGSGGFAGGGGTNFAGSANGTHIALNSVATFAGNFFDLQSAANPVFTVASVASAVNGFKFTTSATTAGITMAAQGTDANIAFNINAKGTGSVVVTGQSASTDPVVKIQTAGSPTGRPLVVQGPSQIMFSVVSGTTTPQTGISITSKTAAQGAAIAVLSSGTDENLTLDAKGAGTITIAGTSTGGVTIGQNLTLSTKNIVTDTTTGTKIGTATTQKLGFFNATPVVQPAAITAPASTASTNVTPWGYTGQTQADAIVTAVRAIITALGSTSGLGLTA